MNIVDILPFASRLDTSSVASSPQPPFFKNYFIILTNASLILILMKETTEFLDTVYSSTMHLYNESVSFSNFADHLTKCMS